VAMRSKEKVCGRLIVLGTAGSSASDGMDVGLLCLFCVLYAAAAATSRSLVHRSHTGCVCVCLTVRDVIQHSQKQGGADTSSAVASQNNIKRTTKLYGLIRVGSF
jgi:hypothetical protein